MAKKPVDLTTVWIPSGSYPVHRVFSHLLDDPSTLVNSKKGSSFDRSDPIGIRYCPASTIPLPTHPLGKEMNLFPWKIDPIWIFRLAQQ